MTIFKRFVSLTAKIRAPENAHPHRTRLTNLLWRERYAKGPIYKEGIPLHFLPSFNASLSKTKAEPYKPIPKRMKDSYCEVILPFRTDLLLREEYVNIYKGLRFGKLMEDLDALAASIAYKHCHDGREGYLPLTIVTASVDRIDLLAALRPDLDMRLSGCVTYVGKSSLEVTIRMESFGTPSLDAEIDETGLPLKEGQWTPLCLGRFTMVAKEDGKTVQVNPLVLETDHEKKLAKLGAEKKKEKLEFKNRSVRLQLPTEKERQWLHEIWLEVRKYEDVKGILQKDKIPNEIALMSDTIIDNVKLCHPQERNIHSSIFGGFLMKEAFELAYANAMLYIKCRPYTVSLDEIAFKKPVPIGSILHLTSQVVYAEGEPHRTFQVQVTAEIMPDVSSGEKQVTNVFHYTFARVQDDGGKVRKILPSTYGEFMQYLEGKRRKEVGIMMKKAQLEEFHKYKVMP